jgi:hypothetical protein
LLTSLLCRSYTAVKSSGNSKVEFLLEVNIQMVANTTITFQVGLDAGSVEAAQAFAAGLASNFTQQEQLAFAYLPLLGVDMAAVHGILTASGSFADYVDVGGQNMSALVLRIDFQVRAVPKPAHEHCNTVTQRLCHIGTPDPAEVAVVH